MTQLEKLYNLYADNPALTNQEAADMLHVSVGAAKVFKTRLKKRGLVDTDDNGNVTIIAPYDSVPQTPEFKQSIYEEMILTYLDDFRQQLSFSARVNVGREIRLLLERM